MSRITATLAATLGAAALMAGAAEAQNRRLNPATPADAVTIGRKVACSTRDGEAVVYHWSGKAYSRVQGERDRHLFNVEGMNVRHCGTVRDPQRGVGYRMTSRELMLYLDPKTNEVLRTWSNPWTSESVEVLHVANDPVNMRPTYPVTERGEPYRFEGRVDNGRVFMPIEVPLFYKNPLAGEYQDFVGNQYHAMEIFNFIGDEADLFDASRTSANPSIAWTRIAEWLPWMRMGDRPGIMIINATGHKVSRGIEGLPAVLRQEIAANYPDYRTPPPLNDTRPNETSWTYFKKWIDSKKPAAPAPAR